MKSSSDGRFITAVLRPAKRPRALRRRPLTTASGIEEIRVEAKKDPLFGSKGYLEVDEIGLYGSMAEASGGEVSIDLAKREFVPISADGGKSASAVDGVSIGGKGGASRVDAASRVGFRSVRLPVTWNTGATRSRR